MTALIKARLILIRHGLGCLPFVLLLTAAAAQRQQVADYHSIDLKQWVVPAAGGVTCRLGTYGGKDALLLNKQVSDYRFACVAYPKGLIFSDGVIEADLSAGSWRDFLGLAFRIRDPKHYECVYFRPAYSGTPSAVQYMPARKTDFDWWDYEAEQYQASAVLPKTSWFHVRLVVRGQTLRVYVDRRPRPVMIYRHLDKGLKHGSVGFWFGNSWSGAYRNLVVTRF